MNATKQPIPSNNKSLVANVNPVSRTYLTSFNNDAPHITGIARKKVNDAATLLSSPNRSPPIIVDPLLLVPGINDSSWKHPTQAACLYVILFSSLVVLLPICLDSITMNTIPYIISASDTTTLLYRCSSNQSSNKIPIIAAGTHATSILPHRFQVLILSCLSLPKPKGHIVLKYINTTANIAPSWITTWNSS